MLSDDEERRDISALALRTVMGVVDGTQGVAMAEALVPPLTEQVARGAPAAQTSAMDVLLDVLSHFPQAITQRAALQRAVAETLLGQLHGRPAMTRRAIQGLGVLGIECSRAAYADLCARGLASLSAGALPAVQLAATLARDTPQRLRPEVPTRVREVLVALDAAPLEESDELREACLQALTALVRSAAPGTLDVPLVAQAALAQLQHDPNATDAVDIDDDDDVDFEYSDDDDLAWKVRRAAARLLAALFVHHHDAAAPLAPTAAAALVARLGEREESVRLEALTDLLQLLDAIAPRAVQPKRKADDDTPGLLPALPGAVAALARLEGSVSVQIAMLDGLAAIAAAFGPALRPHVSAMLDAAFRALDGDAHAASRHLAALSVLRAVCTVVPDAVVPVAPRTADALTAAAASSHHRTALAGLGTCTAFLKHVAPLVPTLAAPLADAAAARLQRTDADAAEKDAALVALDAALCAAGAHLSARLTPLLTLIRERLTQEVIRERCIAVVQDVVTCASLASLNEVAAFAAACVDPLVTLARMADHTTRIPALNALYHVLALAGAAALPPVVALLQSTATWPEDRIGSESTAVLTLATRAVALDARVADDVSRSMLPLLLPRVHDLAPPALDALCGLVATLSAAGCTDLVAQIKRAADVGGAPLAFARCLGAASCGSPAAQEAVLAHVLTGLDADTAAQSLAMHTLGVLGQGAALAAWAEAPRVYATVQARTDAPGRAYALGGMLLGDARLMPEHVAALTCGDADAARVLREALAQASDNQLKSLAPQAWSAVAGNAKLARAAPDAVGEALARMAFIDAPSRLAELRVLAAAYEPETRAAVLGAVRALLALDREHVLDTELAAHLGGFLALLGDGDLGVRRAAVMALHAAVYNRAPLVRAHLVGVLPALYDATVVREELKRKVVMGPFVVVHDDGLDLRKNAFEALFTLVESCLSCLDVGGVIQCAVRALRDDDSVKLLGCLMIVRLADLVPDDLVPGMYIYVLLTTALGDITPLLQAVLARKVRDNATKQEVEKAAELTHAALRVLARLIRLPSAGASPQVTELDAHVRSSPHAALYARLVASP